MKASQITPAANVCIDLPNTDARRLVHTQFALDAYVAEYGDVDVVQRDRHTFEVPAFARGRAAAESAKLAWCEKNGCE